MPLGASRLSFLAKTASVAGPVTQLWSDYDATNNGSDVVVYDDTVAGDGNARHRLNMFNNTYGVISYDKADDSTNTYWRQITLSDVSVTLGSENSYASPIALSHVTTQIGINAATNKIVQGHMVYDGTNYDLEYVVFTLSGSSVSASSVKTLDGTGGNWHQHANIFELDFSNNRFVFEGQEGVSVIDFNTGTDTLSEVDYFDYTSDGTQDFSNVACFFTKIDSSNWLLVGSDGTNHKTQGYTISGSTISELSGTNTTVVAVSSTATAMSRAAANAKSNSNASMIYTVGDSTNNRVVLYPIKATTSSVSVGTALTFNPTNSTSYGRVDNSVWIDNSTYVGIYGMGDNNTILKPFSYDFSTNAITEYSPSVTETQVNTDGGYIFQARKADRVDAERVIVAWSEAGVDTTGDLTVKVIKAGPTGGAGASWDDWTSSNVGDLAVLNDDASERTYFPMSWTNDAFWNIGNNDGDRDVYWLDKYNVSASGGITFDSRTVADKTGSAEFAFTGTGSYNFRTYDKGVGMTLNGKYYVFTHSSGSLSMSAEKTLNVTTNYSNFGFIGHPTDDDTIYRTVGNGIVQKMSWNNSTDTLTVDTTTTAPAGIVVRGAHSFFTYDGSTYKLAMVYWDNTNTTWKIRHFAIDLSSYTDVTLSGTVTPSSPDQPRHYVGIPKKVKLNEYIQSTSDASGNLAVFSITYDGSGSSFTENTAITQAPPSGNYLRGVGFTNHIADNVFATQVQWTESAITTNRDNYIYFWKSSSGTLTQLGSVLVNDPDTENAGNGRGGFELSPDGSFLYVANEGSDNSAGVEDAPVVSVIKRGT